MHHDFQADIDLIARIEGVPTLLDVVCRMTSMRFAAVARVTDDRWIACEVLDKIGFGLKPGDELKIETTICTQVRSHGAAVIIDHVAQDEVYCGHPTPAMYGFQSYISMPIILRDGSFFGTLCALDPRPARLKNPETIGMFKLFAELIAFHIEASRRLKAAETSLSGERETALLREQFIAILGHDLRNPVASIDAGAKLLLKTPLNDRARSIVGLIQGSVIRMSGLIDNVLDFARGRLGGGIVLTRDGDARLDSTLEHVVDELRSVHPDRTVMSRIALSRPINCDCPRVAQLLSNLLANALTHGDPEAAVLVEASDHANELEISVSNQGLPIPPEAQARLFQPFARGESHPSAGLGLGLYIASEIAKAHGGTLDVASTPEETRFTFRMPIGSQVANDGCW